MPAPDKTGVGIDDIPRLTVHQFVHPVALAVVLAVQADFIIPVISDSSVYSGDSLIVWRERLMMTFESVQLTLSIHCGETRTFFPCHQLLVLTIR